MNFGRAKTILIVLFAIVNMFLAGYIFVTSNDILTPDSKTISNAVNILNKRNVFLKNNVKLSASENINYLNLKGITSDEKILASKLLGPFTIKNSKYISDSGDLKITNGEFLLNIKDNHTFKEFSEKAVSKYAVKFLKEHEMDVSDLKVFDVVNENGNYKVTLRHYFFDKPLFNVKTDVYISGGGVYRIEGSIFTLDSLSESKKYTNNPINVLLSYSAERQSNEKIEIAQINAGYYTENKPNDFKSISALPCYEIVLTDGSRLYFDAVSAKMVK